MEAAKKAKKPYSHKKSIGGLVRKPNPAKNKISVLNVSGIPKPNKRWASSTGLMGGMEHKKNANGYPSSNKSPLWKNAAGVGAIAWNMTGGANGTGAYEDPSGKVYILNDDGVTFDDGSGTSFNADGTLATGSSTSFLGQLGSFFTAPSTTSAVVQLATSEINANTTLNAQQKAAQIAQAQAGAAVANNWVLPTVVVGGIIAAGFAYWLIKRKNKG